MSFPIQTLVVNKADKKHTIGPLDAQVRLVNPDHPVRGRRRLRTHGEPAWRRIQAIRGSRSQ